MAKLVFCFGEILVWLTSLVLAYVILQAAKSFGFTAILSFYLMITFLTPVIFSLVRWTLLQKQIEKMTKRSASQVDWPFMLKTNEPISVVEDETKRFDTDKIVNHQ